ncbi:hypothetical protein F4X33_20705 [Candidatus Poribacteria bacterium]|nr:hypothetical protein [Candidatus Poribacteria bacterium]
MAEEISKNEKVLAARIGILQQLVLSIIGILERASRDTICPRLLQELEDYVDRVSTEPPQDKDLNDEVEKVLDELRTVLEKT